MNTILIGLGTNLGDKKANLTQALRLMRVTGFEILKQSPLYETKPWGYANQDDFWNMTVLTRTAMEPYEALEALQKIENALGRVREGAVRFGPRTLDLDILDIKGLVSDDERLTLPHPRLGIRAFVLAPLCMMDENYVFADGKKARALYEALSDEEKASVKRLNDKIGDNS